MELRLSLSGEPVEALSSLPFAGVGLLRGEFILRERCESLRVPEAANAVQRYLYQVCQEFKGREVWYRLVDLWSDEARTLVGSPAKEFEHNPMLGQRGIRPGLIDRRLMQLELALVAEVANSCPNLHVLTPFVQDASEFALIADMLAAAGHPNRIGSMLEIPSAAMDAASFARAGATNLLIGLNDLSCLLLGRDRGPQDMKLHPALWRVVEGVRDSMPTNIDWGLGGALSEAVLARAAVACVPYVCLHYADAPALAGLPPEAFPHTDYVRKVKEITARAKASLGLYPVQISQAVVPHTAKLDQP